MYDEALDDDGDEETEPAYTSIVDDPAWTSTRQLALEGTVFLHRKHAAEVHPGVQHKLLVWQCEAHRPATHCPCGLYALQWLDDDRTRTA